MNKASMDLDLVFAQERDRKKSKKVSLFGDVVHKVIMLTSSVVCTPIVTGAN